MIIFRCNAGPSVGFGHLSRCRVLARALNNLGGRSVMAGPSREYCGEEDIELFADWFEVRDWAGPVEDAERLLYLAERVGANAAVLDDYRIDDRYQQRILGGELRWLQFAGESPCDIWADAFVNPSPGERPESYQRLLRVGGGRLLLGPEYAALRPEFAAVDRRDRSETRRVLVTFGGGDDLGAILFVLSTMVPATASGVEYVVVSGRHNPRNRDIFRWIENEGRGRVELHINPPEIARLFNSCDFAIMGGGTTSYEVAACGIPMVLIAIVENQVQQSQGWAECGAAVFLGRLNHIGSGELADVCLGIMEDRAQRQRMSETARGMVDGRGAERLARELLLLSSGVAARA